MITNLLSVDPAMVGPYRLLGRLGQGGMGVVYLARSPGGRQVAVKVIKPELAGEPGFRTRFAREVAAARNVSGMFTALVVDADTVSQLPWLATAYVPGQSLSEAVETEGPLPTETVLQLAAGLAEGLQAIHLAKVVHRDLKPSNVLLAADGPRVIDFGISKATETSMLTQTGTVMGTPGYLSPEQAEGAPVTFATDIFSLGGVLTYAVTGTPPFGAGPSAALLYRVVNRGPDLSAVPDVLRPLIERCMAKDPAARPTPAGLLEDLDALGAGVGVVTPEWLPESVTATIARYVPTMQTPVTPPAPPREHDPTSIAPLVTRSETAMVGAPEAEPAAAGGSDAAPLTPAGIEVSSAVEEAPPPLTPADPAPVTSKVALAAVPAAVAPTLAAASVADSVPADTVFPDTVFPDTVLAGPVLADRSLAGPLRAVPAAASSAETQMVATPAVADPTGGPGGPGGPGGGNLTPTPGPGQRRRLILAAAAALVILAGTGAYFGLSGSGPHPTPEGLAPAADVSASTPAKTSPSASPSPSAVPSPHHTPTKHPTTKPAKHPVVKVTPAARATVVAATTAPNPVQTTYSPPPPQPTPTPPPPKPTPTPTPPPSVPQTASASGASDYGCSPETSSSGGSAVTFDFYNHSSAGVSLSEYTTSGALAGEGSIGTGQSESVTTYPGYFWLVEGSVSGCLGVYGIESSGSVTVSNA
jgi:eukaryotic-like serine/threonine-protein kinase